MNQWRIATVHLDDDEYLLSVDAVVTDSTLDRLSQLMPNGRLVNVLRRDRTAIWVEIDDRTLAALHSAARVASPADPRHVPGMYDSISRVLHLSREDYET